MMSRVSTALRCGAIVAILGLVPPAVPNAAAAEEKNSSQVTITGIVKRAEISRSGAVRRVYIEDESRKELLVNRTGKGKELSKHVLARVQATGRVARSAADKDFPLVIDVIDFTVVEEAQPRQPSVSGI